MADVLARDRAMWSTPEGITEVAALVLQRTWIESTRHARAVHVLGSGLICSKTDVNAHGVLEVQASQQRVVRLQR
jgi:hypothetical protein